METTHTKEPWNVKKSELLGIVIRNIDGLVLAKMRDDDENSQPNAIRIVRCVNALKGVSDPSKAIAEAKELLKEVYQDAINDGENFQYYAEYYSTKIKQVLASLGEEVE